MDWYIPEIILLKNSEKTNIDNIENVDAIILNGGEYTTKGDFICLMKKNPKVIILDDTNVYKCKEIRQNLLRDSDWKLHKENQRERMDGVFLSQIKNKLYYTFFISTFKMPFYFIKNNLYILFLIYFIFSYNIFSYYSFNSYLFYNAKQYNMNCIFICVFNQEQYVYMFFLLLESIFIYGNLDENTNILVYTSTPFMNIIKNSVLFNDEKIKFEINDTYNDIDKACKSRLDLFNLSSASKYDKFLYLDTDIIVKNDVNKVFHVCTEDLLYALEEERIDSDSDCWGKSLFGNEIHNYVDKTAFSSGILLFNNCEKIRHLFSRINEDIIERPRFFSCYDQPYIVYNAFKYNLYNNKILKSYVVNNNYNIHTDKVVNHFPGGPGSYHHKMQKMTTFLNDSKHFYY